MNRLFGLLFLVLAGTLLFCFRPLCRLLGIPNAATVRAVRRIRKRSEPQKRVLSGLRHRLTEFLAGQIRLNRYRREELLADLRTAGQKGTPEAYLAGCVLDAARFLPLVPVGFWLSPVLGGLLTVGILLLFALRLRRLPDAVGQKRREIEAELPRLVGTVRKVTAHSRDVLAILDEYRLCAGPALRRELDITVADMRSGNYEMALTRMETRVSSPMLGDVVRGLISLIRGDRNDVYWARTFKGSSSNAERIHLISSSLKASTSGVTIFGISSLLVSAGLVSMYSCLYASVMTDCKTVRYLRMVGGAKRCPFPSVRPIGEEKKSIIR